MGNCIVSVSEYTKNVKQHKFADPKRKTPIRHQKNRHTTSDTLQIYF